ncbi:DUF1674 domain-containing protein [Sandaracinobacteroides hominis]|uniref:DUF1674 domain-containing protein n=1 Tax=Sandaracinobacteroides hominis TaxID=2780086 RepID=UPI0018F60C3A|nr:DUF1674 domain-containing protein [Sandaracinobacteroides hominis]
MTAKETPKKREAAKAPPSPAPKPGQGEIGGRGGLEPTRYGDWEVKGICSDF